MTYQIVYASESSTPMQTDDLEELLEHARDNNAEQGITGALVYVDGVFLQVLEGRAGAVQVLMARISKDLRHETVTVLKEGDVSSASFADWKMAYVSATSEQVATWAGLGHTSAIPEVLQGMTQDPQRATQLAASIVAVLAGQPIAQDQTG